MPRHDWNTNPAHSQKPHHKKMHSGAHGRGLDRKLKEAKRGETPRRNRYEKRVRDGDSDMSVR